MLGAFVTGDGYAPMDPNGYGIECIAGCRKPLAILLAYLLVNEYLSTHCASSRHLMSRLLARTVPAMSKERHG